MPLVQLPDLGKGVNADLSAEELQAGVWSSATNMRFMNGFAQRFNGLAKTFDTPTVTPYYITPYQTNTTRYFVHAGLQRVFADNGVARVELTRLAEIAIASIARTTSALATLTTSAPHGLSTGNLVTVYGALPNAFNVTNEAITVTGPTTFTYALTVDPGTSATRIGRLIGPGAAVNNFTGAIDDRWTGGVLGGVLVMNNGVDAPQYWGGGAQKLQTLPGWNAAWTAQVIIPFKNYLVALDVTKSGTRNRNLVKWSVAAVPGAIPDSWDETDLNREAGELDIAETPDFLVDALPMGDSLFIYKERSMYVLRSIPSQLIFQVQRLPGDSGMLARGCGAVTPVGHVVLTPGDVVLNTGQGVTSIANGQVRRYIFNNIDSTNYKRAFVTTNPQRNEVLVCFPLTGSSTCNKAAVWNWVDKTWGFRDIGDTTYGAVGQVDEITQGTWASDSESWDLDVTTWGESAYAPNEARLLLSQLTQIAAFDASGSDDGVNPVVGTLERTGMYFDDAQAYKLMRGVWPRIDAPTGSVVTFTPGAAAVPHGVPTWGAPVSFVVGQDPKADFFAQGRYNALRISCAAPWRIRAMDVDVVKTGKF